MHIASCIYKLKAILMDTWSYLIQVCNQGLWMTGYVTGCTYIILLFIFACTLSYNINFWQITVYKIR